MISKRLKIINNSTDYMGIKIKDSYALVNSKGKIEDIKFNVYQSKVNKSIFSQTYTKEAQDMICYLNKKVKLGEIKARRIYILNGNTLKGYAAYNHKTDILFISEKLMDEDYLHKVVNDSFFVANSLDDIILHEMTHKSHWNSIKKFALQNNLDDLDKAKELLEFNLERYIKNQRINDFLYIQHTISQNAQINFDKKLKNRLNELIADGKILIDRNQMNDNELKHLIKEVLKYDV